MATLNAIRTEVARLNIVLCRRLDPEQIEVISRAWREVMDDLDDCLLVHAVRRCLKSAEFWIAPAQVIQAASEIMVENARERQTRALLPEVSSTDTEAYARNAQRAREILASLKTDLAVPQ